MFVRKMVLPQFALIAMYCFALAPAQGGDQRPTAQPGTRWTDAQILEAAAPMRAGRALTPKHWPNGAKVAVCLSWDIDTESYLLAAGKTEPVALSSAGYGAIVGLRRVLALYDRYGIPGSFYVPAVAGLLYPELITEFKKHPQHEVGLHGWIHENVVELNDRAEEARLLHKAIDFWTHALGHKPVGHRAPSWAFSSYTLDLLREAGLEYDTSAMALDEPYEIVSHGQPTGLVELPVSWYLDDAASTLSPEQTFKTYQDDFDRAYQEGTFFMLTMHPHVSGHRSSIIYLERLIEHMKSKGDVWFATGQQIAEYVKRENGLSP